ncbi:MAG TPA: nucleotide exchange factor GrpE [Candidatus Paceibacterota bacterium]
MDDQSKADINNTVETDEGGNFDECVEKLKKLKDKLKVCEQERGGYLDGWQRSKADYANFKKEILEREREVANKVRAGMVADLFPVLDSMEQAKAWVKNLGPIEAQLGKVLLGFGLEKIGTVGEGFDTSRHEALEVVEVAEPEKDNIIVELVNHGYSMAGKVLKPAKVRVGVFKTNLINPISN